MLDVRIKIYNGSNAEVLNKVVRAKAETEALIEVLQNEIIVCDGDTIIIEVE